VNGALFNVLQADHQAITDQLIVAHAAQRRDILDPHGGESLRAQEA
jgi:hypothetical protein